MSEPTGPAGTPPPPPAPTPPPPGDPNYILSQDEFHATLAAERHRFGKGLAIEVDGLRETAGWVCISLACWLLMIGWLAINKSLRGGPRG